MFGKNWQIFGKLPHKNVIKKKKTGGSPHFSPNSNYGVRGSITCMYTYLIEIRDIYGDGFVESKLVWNQIHSKNVCLSIYFYCWEGSSWKITWHTKCIKILTFFEKFPPTVLTAQASGIKSWILESLSLHSTGATVFPKYRDVLCQEVSLFSRFTMAFWAHPYIVTENS